jgi:hypothetical protein
MSQRDPRIDPAVGDALQDRLGTIHVVSINERKGVDNVTWERQPAGMAQHQGYRLHSSLTRWREKMAGAEIRGVHP